MLKNKLVVWYRIKGQPEIYYIHDWFNNIEITKEVLESIPLYEHWIAAIHYDQKGKPTPFLNTKKV